MAPGQVSREASGPEPPVASAASPSSFSRGCFCPPDPGFHSPLLLGDPGLCFLPSFLGGVQLVPPLPQEAHSGPATQTAVPKLCLPLQRWEIGRSLLSVHPDGIRLPKLSCVSTPGPALCQLGTRGQVPSASQPHALIWERGSASLVCWGMAGSLGVSHSVAEGTPLVPV